MTRHIFLLLLSTTLISCGNNPKLAQAMDLAGDNRAELEHVLQHYSAPQDSLKLRAAEFLITHMINHSEYITMLYQKGVPVKIDEAKFVDSESLNAFVDSMCRVGQFELRKSVKKDIETITSGYLIRHIELAFQSWEKPWAKGVDFDSFCNYILPYRGGREPLSDLRAQFYTKYVTILDSAQVYDPVAACRIINTLLQKSLRYELKMTYTSYTRPIEHIYESGYGGCDDLCLMGLYIMRSVGIPVTKDFTLWGRMLRGHAWCTVQSNDKQWHAFGPAEDQPDSLLVKFKRVPHRMFAKVHRETFATNENDALRELLLSSNYPRAMYNSTLIRDVTYDYCPSLSLSFPIDHQHKFSFLCVYNDSDWRAVDFAKTNQDRAQFNNIGTDFIKRKFNIIYAHCIYDGSRLIPYTPPFELLADGQRVVFSSSGAHIDRIYFPTEDAAMRYDFCYWSDDTNNWEEITPVLVQERDALFEHIPAQALFVRQATTPSGKIYRRLGALRDGIFVFYT